MREPLAHRPEIDGLRAIAIVAVIVFHAGFEILPAASWAWTSSSSSAAF